MKLGSAFDKTVTREELQSRHDELQRQNSILISGALIIFLLACFFPGAAIYDKNNALRLPAVLTQIVFQSTAVRPPIIDAQPNLSFSTQPDPSSMVDN